MYTNIQNPVTCEVRSVIRFLNAKKIPPAEIYKQIVKVYGEDVMNEGNVRKWCQLFDEGRTNVHGVNVKRSRSPSPLGIDDLENDVKEHLQDKKHQISFQYVTQRLKDTAMPFNNKVNINSKEYIIVEYKNMDGRKRLKSDVIPQKFCDSEQSTSTSTKQNKIRRTAKNLDKCLEEAEIIIKEELQADEIEIKYNPLEIDEEFKFGIHTQDSEILSNINIKTEPSDLDFNSVYDKDISLVSIKTEPSDTEVKSENVFQPLTNVPTIKSDTFFDEDEDPLKL